MVYIHRMGSLPKKKIYRVYNYDRMISYIFAHEVLLVFHYAPGSNANGADFAPRFGCVVFQSITYMPDNPCRFKAEKSKGEDFALHIITQYIFGEHITNLYY